MVLIGTFDTLVHQLENAVLTQRVGVFNFDEPEISSLYGQALGAQSHHIRVGLREPSQEPFDLYYQKSKVKGKIFYGQEPPSGESTTTECWFNYQLLAVIY